MKTGLLEWLTGKAAEDGVELDLSELEEIGLSDPTPFEIPEGNVMLSELDGTAVAASEIFLGEHGLDASEPYVDEKTGLMWGPIIREGQWAVRPGPAGQKRKVPLKVIAGNSKNARKEIGLADLHKAFHDQAIQHVTVPTSHSNTLLENQGFIRDMKIVTGKVTKKGGVQLSEPQEVAVLMGAYDITEPETKGKMERGTIANRSAGILYDYCNTESGTVYPSVVEHVALTNKPWITGMKSFFRKVRPAAKDATTTPTAKPIALSLSDEAPTEDELALSLEAHLNGDYFDTVVATPEATAQDDAVTTWSKEESPQWLRKQAERQLREARYDKDRQRIAKSDQPVPYDESRPYYRVVEAKPGACLIASDYGENADQWHAPQTVKDGVATLAPFKDWTPLRTALVPDPKRPAPKKEHEPLAQKRQLSRIELAQQARKQRAGQADANPTPTGGLMADEIKTEDLSEGARARIAELEAKLAKADDEKTNLSQKLDRFGATLQQNEVDKFITRISAPVADGGLGLSEADGFGGTLTVVRDLMLADDGEPAVQSENFSTDGNKEGTLSLSQAIEKIFDSFKVSKEGITALSENLKPGSEATDEEKAKEQLDTTGKPATKEAPEPKADKDKSTNELLSDVDEDFAGMMGLSGKIPAAAGTTDTTKES